jgi:hypothetical protein
MLHANFQQILGSATTFVGNQKQLRIFDCTNALYKMTVALDNGHHLHPLPKITSRRRVNRCIQTRIIALRPVDIMRRASERIGKDSSKRRTRVEVEMGTSIWALCSPISFANYLGERTSQCIGSLYKVFKARSVKWHLTWLSI